MIGQLLAWLGPGVIKSFTDPLLEAYKTGVAADNDALKQQVTLVQAQIALATEEAKLRSAERIALRPWHPVMLIGYGLAFYVLKVVVWDASLGLGSTDAIKGDVAVWLGMTMQFFVGGTVAGTAAASVAAILARKR